MPYTLAVHQGDDDNPQAHLVVSERKIDGVIRAGDTWFKRVATGRRKPEEGGARKSRRFKLMGNHMAMQESWAKHVNRALEKYGHDSRVDHRSLVA